MQIKQVIPPFAGDLDQIIIRVFDRSEGASHLLKSENSELENQTGHSTQNNEQQGSPFRFHPRSGNSPSLCGRASISIGRRSDANFGRDGGFRRRLVRRCHGVKTIACCSCLDWVAGIKIWRKSFAWIKYGWQPEPETGCESPASGAAVVSLATKTRGITSEALTYRSLHTLRPANGSPFLRWDRSTNIHKH